jgi:hypothetical protein
MARGDKSFTSGNKYVRIMAKGDKNYLLKEINKSE